MKPLDPKVKKAFDDELRLGLSPRNFFVSLWNQDGEITAPGYERQRIEFGGGAANEPIGNKTEVRFARAVSDWGHITRMVILDDEGHEWWFENTNITVMVGDQFILPPGNVTLSDDGDDEETDCPHCGGTGKRP